MTHLNIKLRKSMKCIVFSLGKSPTVSEHMLVEKVFLNCLKSSNFYQKSLILDEGKYKPELYSNTLF